MFSTVTDYYLTTVNGKIKEIGRPTYNLCMTIYLFYLSVVKIRPQYVSMKASSMR